MSTRKEPRSSYAEMVKHAPHLWSLHVYKDGSGKRCIWSATQSATAPDREALIAGDQRIERVELVKRVGLPGYEVKRSWSPSMEESERLVGLDHTLLTEAAHGS